MKLRATLLASMLATTGCTTLSGPGASGLATLRPPSGKGEAAMVGGLISGSIGSGLGAADRKKALEAEYRALEYTPGGQKVRWGGDSAGRSGEVVPAQPYRVGSQDCRQYTHTVVVDGSTQTARGTACRNEDGSWATLS